MSKEKGRTRIVTFRITEEEYEELWAICVRRGTRNMSALTRLALAYIKREEFGEAAPLERRLQAMNRRIEALEKAVRRVSQDKPEVLNMIRANCSH
jgi:hypothetical protein